VAFRLDDIQDHYLNKVNMRIMEVFQEKNIPLNIGIVGDLFGQDKPLIAFIKNSVNENGSMLDISNHGWNHEDFRRFNIDNQSLFIKRTNDRIYDVLGIKPSIFIPPFNVFNNDTLIALKQNGIKYISSSPDRDAGPYGLSTRNMPFHFPSTAFTGDNNETYWFGLNHKKTLNQIDKSIRKYGFAVVGMHPYEFSNKHTYSYKPFFLTEKEGTFVYRDFIKNWDQTGIDLNQIKELQLLIDELKDKKYRIVPIERLVS
jgi:peptidoglycan/xylan/chitin deacetylase (PgdA/CDA1 family)